MKGFLGHSSFASLVWGVRVRVKSFTVEDGIQGLGSSGLSGSPKR